MEGNKCLKVLRQPGRLQADVVPAIEHRLYTSYLGEGVQRYIEGIAFWDRSWREIVNFPKQHIQNGFDKNDATGGTYKPTVRIIKNARSYLIDKQHISKGLAPSYFVECLIYNVPNDLFVDHTYNRIYSVLKFLNDSQNSLDGFMCQNGIVPLFGPTPEQWSTLDAGVFIRSLANLWDNWPL